MTHFTNNPSVDSPPNISRTARALRGLGFWGLLSASLVLVSHADAQETKRQTPLRTPTPRRPTLRPVQPKADGGDDATPKQGTTPQGPAGAPPGTPDGAGNKVGTPADIEYKGPPPGGRVNFNVQDAELLDLVKTISQLTGRRFIIGGKVRTNIKSTIISPKDVSTAEAYMAFLAVLEQNGLTVVPHGRYLKIVESTGSQAEQTSIIGPAEPVPYTDAFVTRLYRLKHIDATEAAGVLNKFKSKAGDITVWPQTNLLIITDTAAGIRRLLRIIEEIDSGGAGESIYMQPIHYTSAAELATQLNEMLGSDSGKGKILADERNNALVIVATEGDYDRILELIRRIDTPNSGGSGTIHVLPLQHARCDDISATLSLILGSGGTAARPAAQPRTPARGQRTPAAAPSSSAGGVSGESDIFEGEVKINCDEATNALVTVSSLRDYAQLRNVIDKLDRPRRQVFIEAVIMDVNVDHATDLGIGFHGGGTTDGTIIYGGSNAAQSLTGLPEKLEALAFGVRGPEIPNSGTLSGTGISIPAFGIVLHALATKGDSNLLATPHILATDNIAATISIGQNIPLQTNVGGGLSQLAGLAQGGAGAAGLAGLAGGFGLGFQAPRQDVGISLTITPQINDSNQVRMDISEEFSTAGAPSGDLGAVPINKRTAETTIIVEDQQTVVIGGLTREEQVNGETKIPILGDIPVLGALFRQSNKQARKVNLLLIITPHVIREQNDLRRIFERKMEERQEFLDRYFVFDDSLPWEPVRDYSRTNGMLERIRQTQLKLADRERLRKELEPGKVKGHEPVKAVQLPAMAAPKSTPTPTTPAARPRPTTTARPRPTRTRTRATPATRSRPSVPGSVPSTNRYRVE